MSIYPFRWAAWAVVLAVVGCQPADEIRSYTVQKEAAMPAMHAAAADSSESTDRMIVAILPDGERAWFLKAVGPIAEIERRADEITKFLETVRVAPGKPHPDWKLPDGWKQLEGTGMRAATILIPTGDENLEMTVTVLGWRGGQDELLMNVNRWRGQMQLAPIGVVALDKFTRELKAGDATMTIVDLEGKLGATGMRPPFAQRAGSSTSPSGESASAGGGSLPEGHPSIAGGGSTAAAPLAYDAPGSWQEIPATGIRKAAFRIVGDGGEALVTVMDFLASAGPMMADPLANANRWRGEVGLPPVDQDQFGEVTDTIGVDGRSGTLVDAIPDTSRPEFSRANRGTLAVMVADGERIWFIKLTGDRDVVDAERNHFRAFLKSVRFTPAGGAGDGH